MKIALLVGLLLGAALGAGCTTARPILAAPRGRAVAPLTQISNVRVFDGLGEVLSAPVDVVLADGKVRSIAPAGTLPAPAGAVVVEGAGRTALPGLVDAHVHLGGGDGAPPWDSKLPNVEAQAAALLYSGVTTIVAAGRDCDPALAGEIAAGEVAGPRILQASRIFTAPEGHPVPLLKALLPWPVSAVAIGRLRQPRSVEEARQMVGEELAEHPAYIKVMYDDLPVGGPHLTPQELAAIVDEAKRRGARTFVHVASPQDALEALEAGAAVLMHVPWDGLLTDEQVQRLAAAQIPIVTTRRIYEVMTHGLAGTAQFSALEREVLPPGAVEAFARPLADYRPPGFSAEYLAAMPGYDRDIGTNLKKLFAAGAHLVAGTDSGLPAMPQGPSLHRELQALVALGVPPATALRMATSVAAGLFDGAQFGVLAPGRVADVLLVEGDPLADITATERIVGVWQSGVPVARAGKPAAH